MNKKIIKKRKNIEKRGIFDNPLNLFAYVVVLLFIILSVLNVKAVRSSGMSSALSMGRDRLNDYMSLFTNMFYERYGDLTYRGGALVASDGSSVEYEYDILNRLSINTGVVATIQVREGDIFRKMETNIFNSAEIRCADAYTGENNPAYKSIIAGREFTGIVEINGFDYLGRYNPIFDKENGNIIGTLFIGIEMTNINRIISENVTGYIITGATIFVAIILSLIMITYISRSRKKEIKMLQSEEMHRVKDKLFSVISHDIRGQMAALISSLRLVIDNEEEDIDFKNDLLKTVSIQFENAFNMLDNMLHWAKNQMLGTYILPVQFDIQKESLEITNNLQVIAASKKIKIINNIESRQVYTDMDMISVIIRNLTTNAIKFTPVEGTIKLSSKLENDVLVLSVADTGVGMSDAQKEKVFNVSETYTSKGTNNEKGTGLGLVLCADFIDAIGGEIWFTSELNKGSTFYFSVPLKMP